MIVEQFPVLEHLERHLGDIDDAWTCAFRNGDVAIQILRFHDAPSGAADTYCSLGLSEVPLSLPDGRRVRQELVLSCYSRFSETDVPSLVASVAEQILTSRKALLRGQVLGPAGSIFGDSRLEALYCAVPFYFEDAFHSIAATDPTTVMVMLLPLYPSEAHLIFHEGWQHFEGLLVQRDPDLLDFERPPFIEDGRFSSRSSNAD